MSLSVACDKEEVEKEAEKSKEAKILKWKFGDKAATISGTDIKITYPFGTDITALTAKATLSSKATISPDPTNSKDYTNPVNFTVTAEDGTTKKRYTVKVTVAKNDEAKILEWKFGDKAATISGTDIKITYPFGTDITALTAKATLSSKATINPDPTKSTDYTNPVNFTVTAEDGTTKKRYTVTVTVGKSNQAKITKWKFGDRFGLFFKDATISGTDIKITYPSGTDITALTAKATLASKASISPDPTNSRDYTNPVIFTVTAEDGTTKKQYTATVTVAKSNEAKIKKWKFGDKVATISGTDIKITYPFGTDITALTAEAILSTKATISPDPTKSTDYTNPVKFIVTAEDGTTKQQYNVIVNIVKTKGIKIYDGGISVEDAGYSLIQTTDGGYAMAGFTYKGAGKSDFWLVKVDSNGNKQWEKTYGGSGWDVVYSLIQTTDGGYAMAGDTDSKGAGSYDFWLVKVDSKGNKQWDKTYGGSNNDVARSLVQTTDGGYAMAGWTFSKGDYWLVKVDSNGYKEWDETYGGSKWKELAHSLIQTTDGGYAMAGYDEDSDKKRNFWLVKVDSKGNLEWHKVFDKNDDDTANSLIQTTDGGYAMAGKTDDNFCLIKVDSKGNEKIYETFGFVGYDNEEANSLIQTKDGGYAMAGFTDINSDKDFLLVKFDSKGYRQWYKVLKVENNNKDNTANSLIQTTDGGYAMTGESNRKLLLVKVDKNGNL